MCSSPKSSGSSTPKVRLKGFFEDMSADKRKRFAEVANRADENRQRRNEINKRWVAKTVSNLRIPVKTASHFGFIRSLYNLLFSQLSFYSN